MQNLKPRQRRGEVEKPPENMNFETRSDLPLKIHFYSMFSSKMDKQSEWGVKCHKGSVSLWLGPKMEHFLFSILGLKTTSKRSKQTLILSKYHLQTLVSLSQRKCLKALKLLLAFNNFFLNILL